MSLPKTEGLYNPAYRFAFTNITAEPFTTYLDSVPLTVQPNQTIEIPHHLAEKMTKELVDQIMQGLAVMDDKGTKSQNQGMSLGVPAMRAVWEEKIVRQLEVNEESPQMQMLRMQIREEIKADMENAQKPAAPVTDININPTEFADLQTNTQPVNPEKETSKKKK